MTARKSTVTVEEVLVTPKMAEEFLGHNYKNRHLSDVDINTYARAMKAGKWDMNGETMKFAKDGTMLDGQHRAHAIIVAGVPVRMLIVRGLDDTWDTIDMGRKRTLANVLTRRGEKNTHALAAVLRGIKSWNAGHRGYFRKYGNHELMQLFDDEHERIVDAVKGSSNILASKPRMSIGHTIAGTLFYVFDDIDHDDCYSFWERVKSPVDHPKGDPTGALRQALMTNPNCGSGSDPQRKFTMAIIIKAWNAYRSGTEIQVLSYKPGGRSPEKFPEPI